MVLYYLDIKGTFPSADHEQLVRILTFLGLPIDFITIISNLYNETTTEFITPNGHTSPIGINRGTLQGDPLSPLLYLMIELLIRWLQHHKEITTSHLAASNSPANGTPMTAHSSLTPLTT
jgi:hypothetical protein